jgi:hypothetical protein
MSQAKKDWLFEYLVKYSFNVPDSIDLQKEIAGMTADEIIEAMEKAKEIHDRLKTSSLGRELG